MSLDDVVKVKHWGRTFMVGDAVISERWHMFGIITRIFRHEDGDHYAAVQYDRGGVQVSDPLSTLRHATEVEIAVREAKKALNL